MTRPRMRGFRRLLVVLVAVLMARKPARAGEVSYPVGFRMPTTRYDQSCVVLDETVELDCTALRETNRCAVRHRFTMKATGACTMGTREAYTAPPRLDDQPMVLVHGE